MIKVEIKPSDVESPDAAGYGYVLRVRDGQNGKVLLSSTSQAYENPSFAQELARRLFRLPEDVATFGSMDWDMGENITMVTTYRDGSTNTEALR